MTVRSHSVENMDKIDAPDIEDMILTFENIANNPLARFLLHRTLGYCQKDGASRLEVALKFYLDEKKEACGKCKFVSWFISYLVRKGATSFGVQEEELKELINDSHWIRGLTSVLKGIAMFGVKKPFIPGSPFQIVWNITKSCNMKCVHCYENAGRKNKNELKADEIVKGLDIMAKAGVTSIAFSGGEPSIHPQILEFINHANEWGMFVAMATNGYILSEEKVCKKFVEAGLQFVQVSIDGLDPNTHDSFRGVDGAWIKAVEAVKNCVKAGLFVEVATTVTEHNYNEIADMIQFVRDLGAHWFMLYNFIPTGKGSNMIDLDISPQKRFKLLKTAYSENENGDMQILSTAPQYAMVAEKLVSKESAVIPTHFYNPEYTNPVVMQLADFVGGCGAGRFYMSVEPNGDMYPCVFFPHEKEVMLGNLLENDFEDVWKNNAILNMLRNKDILKGHCGVCDSKNICGGCRARAYNYFHDLSAPDPGCINNETEWQKVRSKLINEAQELPNRLFIDLEG